ncbi:pentatricopeptide repeat-containing protein At1g63330-like [Populus trichocarpa]|uniref:pentatricopeptide repeat-containing protein At1g63330-like n=1 Tax=Populus trichocarpa TaxID=3694 RepID=UPI0022791D9F|nr:pentatricopeptide repeat-containing protein At1g63330-like [Populus trichocarpa]
MVLGGHEPDVISYSTITGSLNLLTTPWNSYLKWYWIGAFHRMSLLTVPYSMHVAFTVLVDGLCKEGMVSEARCVFETMTEKGAEPDVYTYVHCLDGWSRRMDEAKPLLAEMSHKDLTPDTVTYSTLMKGLCRGGRVLDAQKLFKEMHALKTLKAMQERKIERDIVLHTILIEGMFIAGKLEVAKELSSKLFVDGMRPTVQTYIKGLLKEGLSDEAYELLRKMEDDGFLPDDIITAAELLLFNFPGKKKE